MIPVFAALLACSPAERADPPVLTQSAEKVTLGTIRDLGPCVVRSSLRRESTGPGAPRSSEETTELRWQDDDHWAWVRALDGRTVEETRVWDAVAWTRTGNRPLVRRGDAEPHRVQLAGVWDPWASLESLANQVVLTPGPSETLEGRRVLRHTASVAAPSAGRRQVVDSVQGTVWIDEVTALRLQGELELVTKAGDYRRTVHLAFSVSGVGADPQVPRPEVVPEASAGP